MTNLFAISSHDKQGKLDFIIFLALFVVLNPVTALGTTDMVIVASSLAMGFYIFIWRKDKIDMIFIWIALYWCLINFMSVTLIHEPGVEVKLSTFIGSLFKLFIGYGIMKLCGIRFIVWFYRLTLVLALISIPFFILQLIDPSFFSSLPFNFIDHTRIPRGDWNGIIFNFNNSHPGRNSGFGGEPGTFGYYIGLSMIFNLILHEGKVNRNFIILVLIGLTTFSTTFYLTLVLFGLFFLASSSIGTKIFYFLICIAFGFVTFQLPFMSEKIYTYVEDTEAMAQSEVVKSIRVNRMATFVNHMNDLASYPLGYGINEAQRTKNVYGEVIDGTNGFSRIALRYGFFGLIYFLVIMFRLFDKLGRGMPGYGIFIICLIFYIAANPMDRDYFVQDIFWLYFIVSATDVDRLVEWNRQMSHGKKLTPIDS